jgi:anti-sigma regulatory factor (Ser/Thr protein kinase)
VSGHGYSQQQRPGEAVSYLELAALPSAPFWARSQTKIALRAWHLPPETIETAELLASELVTNAIAATGPVRDRLTYPELIGVERISLTLRHLPGRVIIEVFDTSPNPPVLDYVDTDAESGRGLVLVQALSKEWNHFSPPSGGKVVFCVLAAEF